MARTLQVVLEDDLSGEVLATGAGETIVFGLDGQTYEIDLSAQNAEQLRAELGRYVVAGRRVADRDGRRRRPTGRGQASGGRDTGAVREWARRNGHEVSGRGRIPAAVLAAYDAAH
ncbi:histone-like nucleoid-structuring protein Lsr2 [Geodermatophilus obscurus]|uniref:histone-like nucleoid-structuring protein Lsr2 n=1 Tax=Geodermatophilus obscurus TaxID=1861 RepID=UPI000933CCEC|nr:Lsr2 family protein [Geodermatophilus obscurus]